MSLVTGIIRQKPMRAGDLAAAIWQETCFAAVVVALVASGCADTEPTVPPESPSSESATLEGIDSRPVDLEAGQLLSAEVVQLGIDVTVGLDDPSGKRLLTVDGLLGAAGSERLLWVAEATGTFRIGIQGTPQLPESRYELLLDDPRPATAGDRQRAEAAKAFYGAEASIAAGEFAAAVPQLFQARQLWAELGDPIWLAEIDHALGFLSQEGGDSNGALEHYQRVLDSAAGDAIKIKTRHNVARLHLDRNELVPARALFLEALEGWKTLGDKYSEARALHDLGVVYGNVDEVTEALRSYDAALELLRRLGNRQHVARTLHNRARDSAVLGRTEKALDDFHEALTIYEELGDEIDVAETHIGLGQVLKNLDRLDEAMGHFNQALEILEAAVTDGYDRAVTLVGIGEVHARRSETSQAVERFNEALEVFRDLGKLREQGYVLQNLGLIEDGANPQQAAQLYGQALRIAQTLGDRDQQAASLLGLARAERSAGNLVVAMGYVERALAIIETLRLQGASGSELRSAYFATKQGYYDFYVDLLMDLARDRPGSAFEAMALHASERARARSQLETLIEAGSEPHDAADPLIRRKEDLQRNIAAEQFQLAEMLADGVSASETDALRREIHDRVGELDELRGEIRRSRPVYAQVTDPLPLSAEEIRRQILDEDTVLLEYQLGEHRSFLWSVTSDSLQSFVLPSQRQVEDLARTAAGLLRVSDQPQYRADLEWALEELSEVLLRPVADQLDKSRILVVGEGALQYVPFAALPLPAGAAGEEREPLIASHEIVHLPSASLLYVLREQLGTREPPTRNVAVFADPVFELEDQASGPSRPLARSGDDAPDAVPSRLYFSGKEAEAILELAQSGENLEAIRFDATKATFISEDLREYRYVHIATHGYLDGEFPELSSLLFSLYDPEGRRLDGRLRLHEIYQLDLRAALVVLSACRTGRGREVSGEGIVGWTQGFMYSGAKRVIVSLWAVDDEATAELMRLFYRGLFEERLSPAASLRQAQDTIRQTLKWRMPYHWAGFVLQGEYL